MMGKPISYEAMAFSAHLPNHCVAFITKGGEPIAGGIFRIERVRSATPEDEAAFVTIAEDDRCPLCDARENW